MSAAIAVEPIGTEERLSRFVLRKDWVRSDQTVRPEAFIPHPHNDLSVSRHLKRPEPELWDEGKAVAVARALQLHGRADFLASDAIGQTLRVEPAPLPENPHHAVLVGWPPEKSAQKIKALNLAAAASFVPFRA